LAIGFENPYFFPFFGFCVQALEKKMKILYAVQGTGNGHLSRAMDVVPCLQRRAVVDVLVSGIQADLKLPFPVKYRMHGLSFIFGKKGGVDLWKTFMSSTVRRLIHEVNTVPIEDYDLIINDFEPISAWACHTRDKECIGLSHQAAMENAMSLRWRLRSDKLPLPPQATNQKRQQLPSHA